LSCFAALVPEHQQQNICGKKFADLGQFLSFERKLRDEFRARKQRLRRNGPMFAG